MIAVFLLYASAVALFVYGYLSESWQVFLLCWLGAGVITLGPAYWWLHTWSERNR